jgi:hypothetical protein
MCTVTTGPNLNMGLHYINEMIDGPLGSDK